MFFKARHHSRVWLINDDGLRTWLLIRPPITPRWQIRLGDNTTRFPLASPSSIPVQYDPLSCLPIPSSRIFRPYWICLYSSRCLSSFYSLTIDSCRSHFCIWKGWMNRLGQYSSDTDVMGTGRHNRPLSEAIDVISIFARPRSMCVAHGFPACSPTGDPAARNELLLYWELYARGSV